MSCFTPVVTHSFSSKVHESQLLSFSEPKRAKHCVAQSCSPRQLPRQVTPLRQAGLVKQAVVWSLHLGSDRTVSPFGGGSADRKHVGFKSPFASRSRGAGRGALVKKTAGVRLHLATLRRKLLKALHSLHRCHFSKRRRCDHSREGERGGERRGEEVVRRRGSRRRRAGFA